MLFIIIIIIIIKITLVVVTNLQILLLCNIFAFCNFNLLVICYDFISHTMLRNGNIEIKLLLLNPGFPFIKREQGETPQSGQPSERSKKSQAKTSVLMATNPLKNSRAIVDLVFQFSRPHNRSQAALRVSYQWS